MGYVWPRGEGREVSLGMICEKHGFAALIDQELLKR